MRITNFEQTGLDQVRSWLDRNNIKQIEEDTIKEALRRVNLSFIAEKITRLQSTLLCELKDSYVQQSQRYVTMKETAYSLPELAPEDLQQATDLIEQAFVLYNKMSELKSESAKRRPKVADYKHGIPIEDARYILPLATKTNISVAMTGDKLYDLFCLLTDQQYGSIFKEFRTAMEEQLPASLLNLLPKSTSSSDYDLVADLYQQDFASLTPEDNMILLNSFTNLDLKVGLGAATSTSPVVPSQKLADWGAQATSKAQGLTERVLDYGHESIAEQARTTFGMMCSLVTYHQQIRHRLSENHRERLANLILEQDRELLVPPRIEESDFKAEFLKLAKQFKDLRLKIYREYGLDKALPFLLNCDQIKLVISTNARIDQEMLAERICNKAQWEIRELSTKKLLQLRDLSSVLYEQALPSCIHGACKEGKMTCGQQEQMRDQFLG
ncbi:FAD-dependent thymidylate synthase [Halanaerobaculum tunisiense]